MIIEDSPFFRSMLAEILRFLKVGKIMQMEDGAAAITHLRQAGKNQMTMQALLPDIIICDYVMSPIDGSMVLRWLRHHDESPDRFIPFIMISGAADRDKVHLSRDLGVTEFMAKPFSVKSIADHLLAVIEGQRQFIYTKDYFGPDRRRQKRPFNGERRVAGDKDVEIVYTATKAKSGNNGAKSYIFRLPNRLREKIAGLTRGPLTIDPALLKAAETQLDRMENDYADWVRGSLKQLSEALSEARSDDSGILKINAAILKINKIAHDLRGQGTTFGYPLITSFAKSLYEVTLEPGDTDERLLDLITAHVDGIGAVIREKIKGDGGGLGRELIRSLEAAREQFATVS
jgi:CheY-like chemotaxis protein